MLHNYGGVYFYFIVLTSVSVAFRYEKVDFNLLTSVLLVNIVHLQLESPKECLMIFVR